MSPRGGSRDHDSLGGRLVSYWDPDTSELQPYVAVAEPPENELCFTSPFGYVCNHRRARDLPATAMRHDFEAAQHQRDAQRRKIIPTRSGCHEIPSVEIARRVLYRTAPAETSWWRVWCRTGKGCKVPHA